MTDAEHVLLGHWKCPVCEAWIAQERETVRCGACETLIWVRGDAMRLTLSWSDSGAWREAQRAWVFEHRWPCECLPREVGGSLIRRCVCSDPEAHLEGPASVRLAHPPLSGGDAVWCDRRNPAWAAAAMVTPCRWRCRSGSVP